MTGEAAATHDDLAVLVLAGGKGSRLGASDDLPPKALLDCLGLPLLSTRGSRLPFLALLHAGPTLFLAGRLCSLTTLLA